MVNDEIIRIDWTNSDSHLLSIFNIVDNKPTNMVTNAADINFSISLIVFLYHSKNAGDNQDFFCFH